MKLKLKLWAAAAGGAVVLLGGGAALAATGQVSAASGPKPVAVYACEGAGHVGVSLASTPPARCPAGTTLVVVGARGATGPAGPRGATGAQGPAGPGGAAGADAILSVSAQTVVTDWPESSGWATDGFTRAVTLTREDAVPASDCGSAATSCWLYTETLADNGTFITTDGHASPNGSSSTKILGAWTGSLTGGGKLEFYASSDSPNPGLVPGTASGTSKPQDTTDWFKLFFPASTSFGLTSGPAVPWLAYDWSYSVTVQCGTASPVAETWNDAIPGDDGQGGADGNISGLAACSS